MNERPPSSILWKVGALAGIAAFLVVLYVALWRNPSHIPSAQIGKPAKAFTLNRLGEDGFVKLADYRGKWVVVNFWASWCGACRQEHELLVDAAERFEDNARIDFLGVNFRDQERAALRYLKREGAFPYPSGRDPDGRTGIDFGVYGLPETFFVNPRGQIVARHVGVLTGDVLTRTLAPAVGTQAQ